ncbi:MAG: hypothetical protein ACR2NM_14355 [Bythopirellula sp.]
MKRLSLLFLPALIVAITPLSGQTTLAQETGKPAPAKAGAAENEWYYNPTAQAETKPLGRLRAETRARQRLTRMESMRWYGFSASRPTASGIPFTTMYSPAWTRPGGRPFAWYTSQRPVVVTSPYMSPYYYPRYWR